MALFFDIGEVVFDGTEVRAVRRQEENMMAMLVGDDFEVFLFVEGSVIPDERGIGVKLRAQHAARPIIDEIGVGGAGE